MVPCGALWSLAVPAIRRLRVKEERTSTESRSTASSVLASRGAVFHVSEDDAASLRTCFKGLKDIGRRQEGLTLYRCTCTPHSVCCTLYTVHCALPLYLYSVQCSISVHCTVGTCTCTVCSAVSVQQCEPAQHWLPPRGCG